MVSFSLASATLCLLTVALVGCAAKPAVQPEPEAPVPVLRREEAPIAIPTRERGRRTAAVSNAVIRQQRGRFRACYDKARAVDADLEGKVLLVFTIRPDGAVTHAEVDHDKSQLKNDALDACLVGVVKGISFPPADEEVGSKMHYPFEFSPK